MRWLAALGVMALAGSASAGKPVRRKEAGGEHIRLETKKGAVHVWIPPGYRLGDRGHRALRPWLLHRCRQGVEAAPAGRAVRASGRNALFIAPEAPDGLAQPVFWPELGDLLQEVRRQTGLRRPWGPVVAMVHSGGYRTAVEWLDDEILDDLVLLDAMYGDEDAFREWIAGASSRGLVVVGAETLRWTEPFARELNAQGSRPDPRQRIAGRRPRTPTARSQRLPARAVPPHGSGHEREGDPGPVRDDAAARRRRRSVTR